MPVLSSFLKSTYLLYKEATQKSLSWVAAHAKSSGYPLKDGTLSSTKIILQCAEWIASHWEPGKTIPQSFAAALNYAIAIRTSHGKERSGKDVRSDERHRYFIDVLEQIRETLGALMTPKVARVAGVTPDDPIALSNRFEQLELEEPSEAFLNAPELSQSSNNVRIEVERDTLEEACFMISLILEDYKAFRNVVQECWKEYNDGTRDLIEISIMTNTAIDLARQLETDAKALFDKHGGSGSVLHKFYHSKFGEEASARVTPGDRMNLNLYQEAEPWLIPTHLILEDFLALRLNEATLFERAKVQEATPMRTALEMSGPLTAQKARTHFQASQDFLFAMLVDFYVVTMKMNALPAEDELTRGLRTVFGTKKLSLWVIFATQMYLDIARILSSDISRGWWDLKIFGHSVHESIYENFAIFQKIENDPWPHSKDLALKNLSLDAEKICQEDIAWQVKKRLGFSGTFNKSNQHWKFHPLRCGLIVCNFKMRYQEFGVQFEKSWQGILYTYHLYYILRMENLLRKPWEDMEALIKAQPQLDLSKRGAKNIIDARKLISSDLGFSITDYGSDSRPKSKTTIVDERAQNIRLKQRWPLTLMFKARFCSDDGRTNLTEDDLVAICSKAISTNELNTSKVGRPTISQLLRKLRAGMVSENASSNFDYLEMNRLCWLLLFKLREHCEPQLIKKYGAKYLPHKFLPFITLAIQNYGMEAIVEGIVGGGDMAAGKSLWVKAAIQYEKFRRENGSKIIDAETRRGFNPEKDLVEVLNAHYDRDSEQREIMEGPGTEDEKRDAVAMSVALGKVQELFATYDEQEPEEVKRRLQQEMRRMGL